MNYDHRIQERNGYYRVQYKYSWWPFWFTKPIKGMKNKTAIKGDAMETLHNLKDKHRRKREWKESNWTTIEE